MDTPGRDTGFAQGTDRGLGHAGRAAEVDVVRGQIGDQGAQGPSGEGRGVSGRFVDDVVHGGPSAGGYRVEFTAQGEVFAAAGPVDEGHLARERLEERAQRGDADAAGQEQDLGGGAAVRGEGAVRSLRPYPGTG